jgi:Arc/MetJ-type ribon-helix-helix transcriptional regulator
MESLQIRLTPELVGRLDRMVKDGLYSNRNEAVRDAVRRLTLEYTALANTRQVRDLVAPKLQGTAGKKIIRAVREEADER